MITQSLCMGFQTFVYKDSPSNNVPTEPKNHAILPPNALDKECQKTGGKKIPK